MKNNFLSRIFTRKGLIFRDDYYDDYKPQNVISEVKSLPRREPTPILENKFRHFSPVHQTTPEPSYTTLNSIPNYHHHKDSNPYQVTPTPHPSLIPSNHRIPSPDLEYEEPITEREPFIHGDPRQPVKKSANPYPFLFPDDPQLNPQIFAPTPVSQPINYRHPEPDFIYQQQEVLPTPQTPVKRKINSRPEENRSEIPENEEPPVQVTPSNRNRKVPRVIDANKARNTLDK